MVHLLAMIWRHLTVEDIGRVQQVCATWRACVISEAGAASRWKEAKEIFMENLNFNLAAPQLRPRLLKSSPRKALGSVINILASPSKLGDSKRGQDQLPPPIVISPNKVRHKIFAEVSSSNHWLC